MTVAALEKAAAKELATAVQLVTSVELATAVVMAAALEVATAVGLVTAVEVATVDVPVWTVWVTVRTAVTLKVAAVPVASMAVWWVLFCLDESGKGCSCS